jgi:hypothetical protein
VTNFRSDPPKILAAPFRSRVIADDASRPRIDDSRQSKRESPIHHNACPVVDAAERCEVGNRAAPQLARVRREMSSRRSHPAERPYFDGKRDRTQRV